MSVSGYINSTIVVVAIDIDGLVAVTEVDAEQTGCIITYVVVVLDFQQVIRVQRLVLAVAEGMLILPPRCEAGTARGRAGQPCPTSTSSSTSTAPQRALGQPGHVYSRGGRRGVRRQPARKKKKLEEEVKN